MSSQIIVSSDQLIQIITLNNLFENFPDGWSSIKILKNKVTYIFKQTKNILQCIFKHTHGIPKMFTYYPMTVSRKIQGSLGWRPYLFVIFFIHIIHLIQCNTTILILFIVSITVSSTSVILLFFLFLPLPILDILTGIRQ